MAFPTGWERKQSITVDNTKVSGSTNLTIIMLVTLDHLDSTVVDGGSSSALNGGGDVRFSSDSAGTTQLACEVVSFITNATPASQECEIWVDVPIVTFSVDTVIYIWYKKAGEVQPAVTDTYGRNVVWVGAGFECVIHAGTAIDSTGNHTPSLVGAPSTGAVAWTNGYIIDDNTKYVQVPHAAGLNIEKNYSVDFWSYRATAPIGGQTYVDKIDADNDNGFRFFTGAPNIIRTRHPNLTTANLSSADTNIGSVRRSSDMDGTTRINSINGVSVGSDTPTGTVTTVTDNLYLGHSLTFGEADYLKGTLGDFWLSKVSRSTDLKLTEFNNQSDPATFATAGTPVAVGGTVFMLAVDGAVVPAGNVNMQVIFAQIVSGSITASGAVSKAILKVLSGAITPSSSLTKRIEKILDGSLTPTGTVLTSIVILVQLTGQVIASGILAALLIVGGVAKRRLAGLMAALKIGF